LLDLKTVRGKFRRGLLYGAGYGLVAWGTYGVIEFIFSTLLVRLFSPETQLFRWQLPLIGLMWVPYLVCGLVLGGGPP